MLRKEKDGLVWFEFSLLQRYPEIRHATFTRLGGVSLGPYQSLNTSFSVGDEPKHVEENRKRIENALQARFIVTGEQIHSDKVVAVSEPISQEIAGCDALITNTSEIALMSKHADCQAAIFYDPVKRVIANVHAGFRGSALNIYKKTIAAMQEHFSSKPENILVCISPSLGPESAEFIHYKKELPEEFWQFQEKPLYFNFWKISEWQLKQAGILPEHIEIAQMDTYANPTDFFSFRRNKITGRLATLILFKDR